MVSTLGVGVRGGTAALVMSSLGVGVRWQVLWEWVLEEELLPGCYSGESL